MFVEQNILNPKVWKSAYEFLSSQNLTELPEGRIDLPVGNAYVTVTDYITKDDADFEFHREYIDLQYVASGCEYIYTTSTEDVKEYTQMYDKKNRHRILSRVSGFSISCFTERSNRLIPFRWS